jgi:hypothetical protein
MKKYLLFVLFVASTVGVVKMQGNPGAKSDKDEEIKKEIIKLEDERDQALMHNDADWFERVLPTISPTWGYCFQSQDCGRNPI